MTVYVYSRAFNSQADADRYLHGYNAFPVWPKVVIDGELRDAPSGTPEATGYYDAERKHEEKWDNRGYEEEEDNDDR